MGRISAGTGLISGLPIQDIVTKLLQFDRQPVDDLTTRIASEKKQQTALLDLSSKLLAFQNASHSLSSQNVLSARSAASSAPSIISASAEAGAPLASYLLTPIAQAQTQQLLSNGFPDATTAPVGAGTITVKWGGFVNPATALAQLNGGAGVYRGQIRVTDRSGASATVDVSTAQTIDDVIQKINQTAGVHVEASINGDGLVLTDKTGLTASNLIVQDLGAGTAAADLGIAGSIASNTLAGASVVSLSGGTSLSFLNDNNGVRKAPGVDDFQINLKDGTSFNVNLANATTLQHALDAVNNNVSNGGKLTASISGTHLVLTDNTGQPGTLSVAALNGSKAAFDLGILGNEQGGGVLAGARIISGLDTVLLRDVNGGSGITTPGQVSLTDRSGATATINLGAAATLNEVVVAINGAGLGLNASVNPAGNGIRIADTTGQSASNLIVADVGGGTTAANLHITANSAATAINSGDLNLRYISENTLLSKLNGGAGIQPGSFQVTDSAGHQSVIDLTSANLRTVGDVLTELNASGVGIHAEINATGDGILLTDTAGGSETLQVAELGGTTAASLKLVGSAVGGQIDGAFRYQATVGAADTLTQLKAELLAAGAPVTLNIVNDGGSSLPYRLLVGSTHAGAAGRLLIDPGSTGVSFATLTPAADAVLQVGSAGAGNLLFTSSTNAFNNVLPGLTVNVNGVSTTPATITVGQDPQALLTAIHAFVDDFNAVSSTISQLDSYDATTQKGGVLQSDFTVRQVHETLFDLVTGLAGNSADQTRSLMQMGITLTNGQLSVNDAALQAAIAEDSAGVQDFLGNSTTGLAKKLGDALQTITNPIDGTLQQRVNSITQAIDAQQDRIDFLNVQIDAKKQLMLEKFTSMERVLATLQAQQSQIANLANLAAQFASSSSNKKQ